METGPTREDAGGRARPERTLTIRRRIDIPATAALIGATVCWGIVPVMLKYLARDDLVPDGFTANAVRYPLSALLYLPWLIQGARAGRFRGLWLSALLPTAFNVVMQTCWGWAPYYLDAGMLAFLTRLAGVWAILGAFLIFRDERPLARSVSFWAGTAVSLAGFVVMSWSALHTGGATPAGIAIMLVCGLCLGGYVVAVRAVMGPLDPLVVFAIISCYTSVAMILLAPLGRPSALWQLSGTGWGILILSSITGIAAAHGLYYIAVQRLGVAIGSLMLMITPFISAVGSYLWLNERLTPTQWIGGLVLLAGAAVVVRAQGHVQARIPPARQGPGDEPI